MTKKEKFLRCIKVFAVFFKIGAFTFGGGYAMIPFIQRETSQKHNWVTDKEILDIIAIAESTPGPIAINSATFVGYKTAGFFGAVFATAGVVMPAFLVILLVSLFLDAFSSSNIIKYAFFGIRAGVIALILKAVFSMAKQCEKTVFALVVAVFALLVVAIFKVSIPLVVIFCAICGVVYSVILAKKGGKKL